ENDCHIPNEPEDSTQPTLAIVTKIDLGASHDMALSDIKSSCIAAPIATIYASLNAVYMVENEYSYENANDSSYSSTVYKLDYSDNGLEFAGSVALSGQVGWNEQFRLSEYQDHLRVVTTDHSSTERNIHRLHTINIDDTELNLNATIPNESAPEAIGKPGESIYSVRFDGDKAYIVTFRQIDPFYVLDLSNHDSPRVAGELELPGFSNYLHPFGDTLVFGLGRGSEGGVATNNIKLALFDVSDMSNPLLVNEVLLEGDTSYSPAEYTHTALSILPGNDEHSWRLGFSASILEDWQWQKDAYYLFEVRDTEHPEGASLNQAGSIVGSELGTGQSGSYYYSSYDRGVLTGTHV
ncbi:beta-propeller domain-containing protein, partial [Oleiphilus sp. HI0061]